MRLDRFITLNLVQPLNRTRGRFTIHDSRFTRLPVLMYHSVSDDPEQGANSYYRVCVSPARFREQMQWLKDNGWQGVALSAGLTGLDSIPKMEDGRWRRDIPGRDAESSALNSELRPVAITFDDGFRDFYTTAWPILHELGFAATMYLPTAFIGSSPRPADGSGIKGGGSVTRRSFRNRDCLTWDDVGELCSAGVEFGSHTVNHPRLVELSWPEVEIEIQKSKSEIEDRLGVLCAAFAYPYAFPQANGNFVERFKHLLQAGGYATCVTTQLGRHRSGDDVLQIKRLPINQEDDLPLFAAKLDGAYDWLGRVQSLSKTFRREKKLPPQTSLPDKQDVLKSFLPQKNTKST